MKSSALVKLMCCLALRPHSGSGDAQISDLLHLNIRVLIGVE